MALSPKTAASLEQITSQFAARERQAGERHSEDSLNFERFKPRAAAAPRAPSTAASRPASAASRPRAAVPPSLLLRYGQRVVLRSASAGYLAVHADGRRSTRRAAAARAAFARFHRRDRASKVPATGGSESLQTAGYMGVHQLSVGVSGTGVGGAGEAFEITNAYRLDDRGPVRFGDTVALRSCLGHARGKLLAAATKTSSSTRGMSRAVSSLPMGVAEEAGVKLTRDQIGKAERWQIQRAPSENDASQQQTKVSVVLFHNIV